MIMKRISVLSSIAVAASLFVSCSDSDGGMMDGSTASISGAYSLVAHNNDSATFTGCTGSFTDLEGTTFGSQTFTSCTCDGPDLQISQSDAQFTIEARNCECDNGNSFQMTGRGTVLDSEFVGERVYTYSNQWTRTDVFDGTASGLDLLIRVSRQEWSFRGESRGSCDIQPPWSLTYTRAESRSAFGSESVTTPPSKAGKQ
jgi:hypothetical protein